MSYAGEVVEGLTVRAIVGTASWAKRYLGGEWHNSLTKIDVPGTWDAEYGFRPLQPNSDCLWENGQWVCQEQFDETDKMITIKHDHSLDEVG